MEGLNLILFSRNEVCGVVIKVLPLRADRDKLSYIENLSMNNLDLMTYQNMDEDYPESDGTNDIDE